MSLVERMNQKLRLSLAGLQLLGVTGLSPLSQGEDGPCDPTIEVVSQDEDTVIVSGSAGCEDGFIPRAMRLELYTDRGEQVPFGERSGGNIPPPLYEHVPRRVEANGNPAGELEQVCLHVAYGDWPGEFSCVETEDRQGANVAESYQALVESVRSLIEGFHQALFARRQ